MSFDIVSKIVRSLLLLAKHPFSKFLPIIEENAHDVPNQSVSNLIRSFKYVKGWGIVQYPNEKLVIWGIGPTALPGPGDVQAKITGNTAFLNELNQQWHNCDTFHMNPCDFLLPKMRMIQICCVKSLSSRQHLST